MFTKKIPLTVLNDGPLTLVVILMTSQMYCVQCNFITLLVQCHHFVHQGEVGLFSWDEITFVIDIHGRLIFKRA